METTTIRIMPDGLQIPRHEVEMVLDGDYWVVRPQNGILNYQVTPEPDNKEDDQSYPKKARQIEMRKQGEVYETLHPLLKQLYLGQHVAIYDGRLVDFDADKVALLRRVDAAYPDKVVLMRQVQEGLPRPLRMSSALLKRV